MPGKTASFIVALMVMLIAPSAQGQTDSSQNASAAAAGTQHVRVDRSSPPPPTIADVVLLLKSYAPDLAKIERLRAELAMPVADSGDPAELARAWHLKAQVAEDLADADGRLAALNQALAYAEKFTPSPRNEIGNRQYILQDRAWAIYAVEGFGAGIDAVEKFIAEFRTSSPGAVIGPLALLSTYYAAAGNVERAKSTLADAEGLANRLGRNARSADYVALWAAWIERTRGILFLAQGNHGEAELAFSAAVRMAEKHVVNNAANLTAGRSAIPQRRAEGIVDRARIDLALAYLDQQRLDEAELLLREVLKSSLQRDGRNSRITGMTLDSLGRVFQDRGRYAEALVIAEWAERTLTEAGFPLQSKEQLNTRKLKAALLTTLGHHAEAARLFDELQQLAAAEARQGEAMVVTSFDTIAAYLAVNRSQDALAAGDKIVSDYLRFYGADHYYSAEARAYRAMALNRSGRRDEVSREFERAIEVLIDPGKAVGKQQASVARPARLRQILNAYLDVLVGGKGTQTEKDVSEAFRLADVARWQSVQKAVTGSALRAAAGSPELGARIKRVQDASDELEAVYKNLIGQRSAPPDKQLPAVIAAMEGRIAALQKDQFNDLAEIRRQFPQYDALVNPRPADLASARKALLPNESLLSIYVTPTGSYVWATARDGALHFHFSRQPAAWVAEMVRRLRNSVDFSTADDLARMGFDLEAGGALYQELLAPVQGAWEKADTLLVVANDALGQIPFSLLPTANLAPAKAEAEASLPLAQFRQTPWLARRVAVAYAPSISALVTLRALPTSKGQRDPFMGFGDPDFGANADKPVAGGSSSRGVRTPRTRKLGISRAARWEDGAEADAVAKRGSPKLMPLPDTREEILAIGTALAADMQGDIYFGAQANRQNVIEADLQHHRVLAFATHGLVAGDLPGLDQPALALAPRAGKDISDGLLKLEDILKLSMDADLVVLSACNTAAADGSGAEAVSGLGRAFFYAGARAVLATHWPVETVSARQLVTHLFERYAKDGKLTRAQALRQAMLVLIDRGVAVGEGGKPEFAYAHPAFWAPYALYGDPGR